MSKGNSAGEYKRQLDAVCSAGEAAKLLRVSDERIKQFCREGRLAGRRIGRDWIICRAAAIALAKLPRPAGARAAS